MPPRRKVTLTLGPRKKQKTELQQSVDEAAAEAAERLINSAVEENDENNDNGEGDKVEDGDENNADQDTNDNIDINSDSIDYTLSRFKNLNEFFGDVINNAINFKDPQTDEIISGPFIKLPPKKIYADYYQLIENPISINEIKQATISKRKNSPEISLDQFADMWILMSSNAATYNDPESLIVNDANLIKDYALKRINDYKNYLLVVEKSDTKTKSDSKKSENKKPDTKKLKIESKSKDEKDLEDEEFDENDTEDYTNELQKIFKHLLSFKVSHHKNSVPLSKTLMELPPKDDPNTEDFYDIVTEPLCFNIINERLENGNYSMGKFGYKKFVNDLNLMFDNYLDVFTSGSYFKSAQGLSKAFHKRIEKFESQILDKKLPSSSGSNSSKSNTTNSKSKQKTVTNDDSYIDEEANDEKADNIPVEETQSNTETTNINNNNINNDINQNKNIEIPPSTVEIPNIIRKHDIEKASKIEEIDDITAFIKKFIICSTTNLNNYVTLLKDVKNLNQINYPSIYETIIKEPAGKSTIGGSNYILQLPGEAVIGHDIACNVYLQNKIIDEKYISELRVNGEVIKGLPFSINHNDDSDEDGMFCANKFALKLGYGLNYCEFTLKVPFPLRGRSNDVTSNDIINEDLNNEDEKMNRQERHEGEKSQEFIENVKIWLNITR